MTVLLMSYILLAGMFLTGGIIIYILFDHHDNAMREYAVLGLFCSILTMISYYVELNTPGMAAKVDAVKFGYIGKVFVTPMLLMLVVRYYNVKVGRLWQILQYAIPILTLWLVFNCEKSGLYYTDIHLSADGLLRIEAGPFYYLYMGYNILLTMVYLGLCLYRRAGLRGREKINNSLLIFASLIPFLSLLAYLSGRTNGFDTSPVGVMAGALIIAFSIFRYGLLNKDEMLQNMATGLVFLDDENRLIFANRAAVRLIPVLGNSRYISLQDLSPLCSAEFVTIQSDGATYQRKITEWSSADGHHGKLLTYDDITEIRARLNRDGMTGLLNHATFYPMLEDAMAESGQNNKKITVSIADIDSFKKINDSFGHANGDIVLIALAKILQEICGEKGAVFRYGGEEFAVIFRADHKTAERTMQAALERFSAVKFDFTDQVITFSYGSAEYNCMESSVELFDRADRIMYERKRALHKRENSARAKTAESGRRKKHAAQDSRFSPEAELQAAE